MHSTTSISQKSVAKELVMRWLTGALLANFIAPTAYAQDSPVPAGQSASSAVLKPLKVTGSDFEVRAGKIEVWENHRTKAGRKIPVNVIVIPAQKRDPNKVPLFPLAGGPGIPATASVKQWLGDLNTPSCLYADRDVVLVDQRGTGGSNALGLSADLAKAGSLQSILSPTDQPPEDLKSFRMELEKRADLTQYGTTRFAEDLDSVRQQLGYNKIDLWGTSYGTRAAQEYIRRYPDKVRTVVLLGPLPMGTKFLMERSLLGPSVLDRFFEDCARDEACGKAFPEIRKEFNEVLDRLAHEPARVKYKHPQRDAAEEIVITRDSFTGKVRPLLASNAAMRMLPYLIHAAHRGDYQPFLKLAIPPKLSEPGGPNPGLYLSLLFTDDLPFLDLNEWDRAVQKAPIGNDLGKLARKYQQIWPQGECPRDFHDPVASDIPALMITGHFDPLTPLEGGEDLVRNFRNGLHVVVPGMSHVPFDLPNETEDFMSVLDDFYDRGSVAGLDTSRLSRLKAPPYLTSDAEFQLKMLLR